MSVFVVILVRIQCKCGKIRTRITPNKDTFYAVFCEQENLTRSNKMSLQLLEAPSEPNQTSKMESFAMIINDFQPLTIFPKHSNLDTWHGFEYASAYCRRFHTGLRTHQIKLYWMTITILHINFSRMRNKIFYIRF